MNRIKRYLIALICAGLVAVQCPVAVFATESESLGDAVAPETIMLNMRNAALQDVLSAIAMNLGYGVVYVGGEQSISVDLENVTPEKAFDYVLKISGMTYLKDGDILIVGAKEILKSDFADSLSLTEIPLQYITSDVLVQQIQTLALPVTILDIKHRKDSLWVQGTPQDIGKVRELANLLDISANRAPAAAPGEDPTLQLKNLISIDTNGSMRPTELNRFLKALGIGYGIVADNTSNQLWLYANSAEAEEVRSIVGTIDPRDAESFLKKNSGVKIIWVGNMTKADAQAAISTACPELQVISTANQSKTLCLLGSAEDIQRAEDVLSVMSKSAPALKTSFFVYYFSNISAAEAVRRLELMTFSDDVSFYAIDDNIAEYANGLFVYCNSDYTTEIQELLGRFDGQSVGLQNPFPVFSSSTSSGIATWQAMFIKVFGLKNTNFMTVQLAADQYILFMRDVGVEQVNLVMRLINQVQSLPGSDYVDLSYEAYVKWCNENNQEPTIAGWQQWVLSQLSLSGAGGGSGGAASADFNDFTIPELYDMTMSSVSNDVNGALDTYFNSYVSTGSEDPTSVFGLLREHVNSMGFGIKSYELKGRETVYVEPTTTEVGRLQIQVTMTTELGESFDYTVTMVLPIKSSRPSSGTETTTPNSPAEGEPPSTDLTPGGDVPDDGSDERKEATLN